MILKRSAEFVLASDVALVSYDARNRIVIVKIGGTSRESALIYHFLRWATLTLSQVKPLVQGPRNEKALGPKDQGFLVAGAGFEPTAFGLWAQRATSAPPRNIFLSKKNVSVWECKSSSSFAVIQILFQLFWRGARNGTLMTLKGMIFTDNGLSLCESIFSVQSVSHGPTPE